MKRYIFCRHYSLFPSFSLPLRKIGIEKEEKAVIATKMHVVPFHRSFGEEKKKQSLFHFLFADYHSKLIIPIRIRIFSFIRPWCFKRTVKIWFKVAEDGFHLDCRLKHKKEVKSYSFTKIFFLVDSVKLFSKTFKVIFFLHQSLNDRSLSVPILPSELR